MARVRYRWETGLQRYRDTFSGRLVSESDVRRAIDTVLRNDQRRARSLANDLRAGRLSQEGWRDAMREVIAEVHLYSAAAAKGGWAQMDAGSYGQVGAAVREQYAFLDNFVGEIASGLPIDGNVGRRATMYVQKGRTTFHEVERVVKTDAGFTEEHNVEDAEAEHCEGFGSCPEQTARGWVPIGTLIPVGDRLCLTFDRCRLAYR